MDLDRRELESQRAEAGLDYSLVASKKTVLVPENSKVELAGDMTAKATGDSMMRQNAPELLEKPNGIPTQVKYRAVGGITHNWNANKSASEHIGVLPCPVSGATKRAAESLETPAHRGKVDISKCSRDRDVIKGSIFGRTENIEATHWPGPVRSPACHYLPQKTNSRVLLSCEVPGLEAIAGAIKGPPPISRHPALLKTLNGYCATNQAALFVDSSCQQSGPKSPISVGSLLHLADSKPAVQSVKETWVPASEAYQGVRVINRQALLLRKDGTIHSSHGNSSGMPQENKSESQGTSKSGSAVKLSLINQKMGGVQPIRLFKEKLQRSSGDQGETGVVGNRGLTVQTPAVSERGDQSGKFLLIDSKGLPYTVFVHESKPSDRRAPGSESEVGSRWVEAPAAPRKLYSCPVCSRVFEYLSYLQRHSITHSEQKPHVCQACGKAFKRTSHLERHKYTHAGGKPHRCPICQRSFRDAGELAHHQRVHTGERPYQCGVCHMRFGERNTLQRHARRKHLETSVSPTEESVPIHPANL